MNARVEQNVAVVSSPPVQALDLRPLRDEDEAAFTAGHRAMAAEGFTFGLGYEPGKPWRTYLKELEDHRQGRNLPARHVPGTSWSPRWQGRSSAGRRFGSGSTTFLPSGVATSVTASCPSTAGEVTPPKSSGRA